MIERFLISCIGGMFSASALCSAFVPGDILVSKGGAVYEYTQTGSLVQSISVPGIPGGDAYNRGMTIDGQGRLNLFNGTFNAGVSVYDPIANSWTSTLIPGLSVVNNGSFGKVASEGNYVFLTDEFTYNGGEPNGIVRFDTADNTYTQFASTSSQVDNPIDLTIGGDGLLYSLNGDGSPSGTDISVYDPNSLALVRTISLSSLAYNQNGGIVRDLRIQPNGNIWLNQLYSPVFLTDANGNLLNTYTCSNTSYIDDFDMAANGELLQTDFDGHVYLYDSSMHEIRDFQTTNYYFSQSFGMFVPTTSPEPCSFLILVSGLMAIGRPRRPKSQ